MTVHLPCISILTPRTSHQTSPSKSPARADSHAATARTSVEFWQPMHVRMCVCVSACSLLCVCVCVFASRQCVRDLAIQPTLTLTHGCVWPARRWEPRRVLQATAMSEAESRGCIPGITFTNLQYTRTHLLTFSLCHAEKKEHTRKYFPHRRPPLHEYSFATVMSCDMLSWQGSGTTWPGC